MAKKIVGYIKLQIPAGKANPSPPVGPALGQRGLNIMNFVKEFNAATQNMEPGMPVPVVITAYADRSFTFITKTPPNTYFLKKAAKIDKGSTATGKTAGIGLDGERSFDGAGSSSQSNQLTGQITVTVAQRLPNGNLIVRGEKWLTINQGQELVRIAGIVRPQDIGQDNVVPSTRVADARISYTGRGTLADANTRGWLSRFFNSKWMPF